MGSAEGLFTSATMAPAAHGDDCTPGIYTTCSSDSGYRSPHPACQYAGVPTLPDRSSQSSDYSTGCKGLGQTETKINLNNKKYLQLSSVFRSKQLNYFKGTVSTDFIYLEEI
jgi:hypothetical protein